MSESRVIVYRYGLLDPTEGTAMVHEQIRLAHRYRNQLVELERARRQMVAEIQSSYPQIGELETQVGELLTQLDTERKRIKATPKGERDREPARRLRKRLREVRSELRDAKKLLREDDDVQEQLHAATDLYREQVRAARAANGLYWGTYLVIEQAHDAARKSVTEPRFRRYDGSGAVAVQLQGGLDSELAVDGDSTLLRIDRTAQPVPGRGGRPLPRLRLRVGSDAGKPVWAEWPLIYHRPLPAGMIKWAKVVRTRIATHYRWSLHITLETELMAPEATSGVVAVDLGWRQAAGTLRAGGWVNDRGQGGEIMVEPAVRSQLEKASDLQSIRDQHMNRARKQAHRWLAKHAVPPDLAERVRYMGQWRSPGRLAALTLWWRRNRCAEDETVLASLEAWRRHDKHLWEWEANARRKAMARRRHGYRVLAARLAREHKLLVIEDINLSQMARIPVPESERKSHPKARAQRVETAPAELRLAVVQAFRARGLEVVEVPPTGPAAELLRLYREGSGAVVAPGSARTPKWERVRERVAEREAALSAESPT